ncbi:MAG: hypothetical protein OZSIB_2894 [Candidatus Ozemobacter sibiricus]|uniref:Uncharacterized protein n=1 Tax=Candidatus Ozemobacter sibiricus TaxID=2268124 RepID=A0A367ZTA9_9BACT|nr:MAG: hypothetical protein OZSIB_2894 [Candidatus Ozemobacter sibiricus]
MSADGWQVALGPADVGRGAPGEIVVIDADRWSRTGLQKLADRGVVPVAWLDVAHPEDGRTYLVGLPTKDLYVPLPVPRGKRGVRGPRRLARFYQTSWREALRRRVRELAHKGVAGLFFTGTDAHRWLTDHPVGRTAMQDLLADLAREFRAHRAEALILLHGDVALATDARLASLVDGLVLDGLWFGPGGRTIRPWERERRLAAVAWWLEGRSGPAVGAALTPRSSLKAGRSAEAGSAGPSSVAGEPSSAGMASASLSPGPIVPGAGGSMVARRASAAQAQGPVALARPRRRFLLALEQADSPARQARARAAGAALGIEVGIASLPLILP